MRNLPLENVYQVIEPGPVLLLTTAHRGQSNVMTMSWHMMVEFEPPLIACVIGGASLSFSMLKRSRECVIAIPARHLASAVVGIGNCTGREVDKFAAFNLPTARAKQVQAPLLPDCFANLECRVSDTRMVNRYGLFILEVVKAWTDPRQHNPKTIHHNGYGRFTVDGQTIKLKSAMR